MSIIITILIYSTILTAVILYKDNSSYSRGIETVDVIAAGPITWLLVLIMIIIRKVERYLPTKSKKQKPIKRYSKKAAQRIIAKIIKWYKKRMKKHSDWLPDTFAMAPNAYDDGDGISGLKNLIETKPLHEYTNNIFLHLLYHQFNLVEEILIENYMVRWTIEDYQKEDFDDYWVEKYKNDELWRVK